MTDKLKLTIVDGTDEPIGNVNVVVENEDSKTTDENGKVEFDLPYGDYTVTVSKDGYGSVTDTLAFRSNHKNFSIVLDTMGTGTVTVTTIDGEDNKLGGADVWLTNGEDGEYIAGGITDANGECTLREDSTTDSPIAQIPYGTYDLYAIAYDQLFYYGKFTVNNESMETTITLGQSSLTVNITGDDVGREVGVYVGLIGDCPRDEDFQITTTGSITFDDVINNVGSWYIEIVATEYDTGGMTMWKMVDSTDSFPIATVNLPLLVVEDKKVNVTVLDENENPVQYVDVKVTSKYNDSFGGILPSGALTPVLTDENSTEETGTATLYNLNVYGEHTIETFEIEGYEAYQGIVNIDENHREFTIQLTPSNSG